MKIRTTILNRFVHVRTAVLAALAVAALASTPALAGDTYHLGLWFNSPTDGAKAGAPGTTPFNGEGDAGVQVLNTGEFPDLAGPLIKITTSGN
jgi:hypothetical protein